MRALILAACLLAAPQAASAADPAAGGRPVAITAAPVTVGGTFTGIELLGAWELSADHGGFGGLSGLLVEDGRFTAITDRGRWFGGAFSAESGLEFRGVRTAGMRASDGSRLKGNGADAEALARLGEDLFVAFERDHRIARHLEDGRFADPIRARALEMLPGNGGLELLAGAGGHLLAIGEEEAEAGPPGFPVFAFGPDGALLAEGRLPPASIHRITGGDIGPDGRLYSVERYFSFLTGVSIRLRRYRLSGTPPMPGAEPPETLAAFETADGIDNMEALALWRDAAGRLRMWVLSDDNFNAIQRTLLLDLAVAE